MNKTQTFTVLQAGRTKTQLAEWSERSNLAQDIAQSDFPSSSSIGGSGAGGGATGTTCCAPQPVSLISQYAPCEETFDRANQSGWGVSDIQGATWQEASGTWTITTNAGQVSNLGNGTAYHATLDVAGLARTVEVVGDVVISASPSTDGSFLFGVGHTSGAYNQPYAGINLAVFSDATFKIAAWGNGSQSSYVTLYTTRTEWVSATIAFRWMYSGNTSYVKAWRKFFENEPTSWQASYSFSDPGESLDHFHVNGTSIPSNNVTIRFISFEVLQGLNCGSSTITNSEGVESGAITGGIISGYTGDFSATYSNTNIASSLTLPTTARTVNDVWFDTLHTTRDVHWTFNPEDQIDILSPISNETVVTVSYVVANA